MPDPRKKIQLLISSLEELRLHVGRKDLAVGKQKVNALLFFTLANACLRGRCVLLYGGMGANKTTLVNLLGTSFLSMTLDEVEDMMVTGHPEQTEEKIVGFLDPRQWTAADAAANAGSTQVLWTAWAKSNWKLINEINRFPSGKQNLFLEILQKRKISYAGQICRPGDTCYFATMNPEFSATYPLDEALLDRISASVPAAQPDFLAGLLLTEREQEVRDLASMLPRLTPQEFSSLPEKVAEKPLAGQVELAILCLIRDFTLCERAPTYDKTQLSLAKPSLGLCSGCHYHNNPEAICWQVDEGLSDRVRQDLRAFCRAFAYLLDRDADLPVLKAIAPYIIWHRTTPLRSALERPPFFGAGKLAYVAELVEKSINRTMNERAEMNRIFSRAVDGELAAAQAIEELSTFDDPIARLDFIPTLEQMR
jgi:MoxR-like ATPase